MEIIALAGRKAASVLLYPIGTCLVFLFAGLAILRWKRNSRLGFWFVSFAAAWLLLTSLPLTSFFFIRPLEDMAGPCANPENLKLLGVRDILVLGGGGGSDRRVVEGIRLWKHIPDSRLILSRGRTVDDKTIWELPARLGVPKSAIELLDGAVDTSDEARIFAETLPKTPFALVTSAYHMPRAMRLFQAMGLNPVAAPCELRTNEAPSLPTGLLPNADALLSSQLAIHEYVGMLWEALKGEQERLYGKSERFRH